MATNLEALIDAVAERTVATTLSAAVERTAEEFARETLADDEFRRGLQEMVKERLRVILARLLSEREHETPSG